MNLEALLAQAETVRSRMGRPKARRAPAGADWFRIENAAGDAVEVSIYDEIGYWGTTAKDFAAQLAGIDAKKITLRVNSPGGDVFDGIAIFNAIKRHPAACTAVVDGLAASAASFIVQAADTIVMAEASQMMIHDAWGLAMGNAADMLAMADVLDKASASIAGIYAARSGRALDSIRADMQAESWYTASEAVDAGLADQVDAAAGGAGTGNRWDLSVFAHAGRGSAPAPTMHHQTPDPEAIRRALKEAFA
jgi:ATP-dependent Clp endopeptidase proteolytic subunit ClpP